ncbi:glycosyltransferase [Nitratifractor sp.]
MNSSSKPTIKVLHTEWSDGWGGQEIRIVEEMKAVRELGVEVALACRPEAKIRVKAEEENIPVYTFPFRGNMDLKTLTGLITLIRKEHIDIVNTHSGKDTWVGGLAAKLSGAKFIRTRHLSNPINPSRLNFINSLADFVITTGESVREAMIRDNRIHPEKILSVPTGVDERRFSPDCCTQDEARKRFGLPYERFIIGNLAVLRSFKRHDLLLEAFASVHQKHPETFLAIAGEGPQRPAIEEKIRQLNIEENVRLVGHTEHPERFLKALDLFVLSSDSKEGVPQSLIQALMIGLPCIAPDIGSVRDLHHDNSFLLLPEADSTLIAHAIEELIDKPQWRKALSDIAQESVQAFSRDLMAKKILEIYRRLL